jgi:iron complex outermembrane recepter protein
MRGKRCGTCRPGFGPWTVVGLCAAMAGWVLIVPQALAQDSQESEVSGQLAEVVVTAQKRPENLQKIPVAVSVLQASDIQNQGLREMADLGETVPGLHIGRSSGTALPFLRGVGNSSVTLGNESSVALYVDGLYFARLPSTFFSLNDISRIEILKGPQGTLFGRNSSGGVIQILTQDPSHSPGAKGSLSYGNFDTAEANLYATTGLTDTLAADVAINGRSQSRGYGTNIVTGNRANYEDNFSIRSKWLFEPIEQLKFTLVGFYGYGKTGIQGNTYPGTQRGFISQPFALQPQLNPYDQNSWIDTYDKTNIWGTSLKAELELAFAQLVSISGYINDGDFTVSDANSGPRPDELVKYGGPTKQFTQELQLQSLPGSPVKWTAGLFYFDAQSDYTTGEFTSPTNQASLKFGPGLLAPAQQLSISRAAYTQATYEFLPRLSFTGGLRYTKDAVDANGMIASNTDPVRILSAPGPGSTDYSKLSYKAALDYQLTDDILVYLSSARGFRSSVFSLLTYNKTPNKPEVLDAYETGIKTELFDRRMRLNSSLFYYKIKDPQVSLREGTSIVQSNAQGARVKGAELELQAVVREGLNAHLSATYLDSYYSAYLSAPSGPANPLPPYGVVSPLTGTDATGNYTPQSPRFSGDIGLDYSVNTSAGSWLFASDYYYSSQFYWEPDNLLRQPSYALLGAQVRYMPNDKLAIRLWGRNLTNKLYFWRANTQAGPGGYPDIPAPPRTYGLSFDFSL